MPETDMYKQLAANIGAVESVIIPKLFEMIADEKEAKILLAAAPPATVDEIAEKTGISKTEVEKMMEPLFQKGLIFKSKKEGPTRYYRVRHILQFHDATILAKDASLEFLDLWKEHTEKEWPEYMSQLENLLPKPGARVIPVNISVEPDARIMAFDDIKKVVENASNLAVTKCTCRVVKGDCGKPVEVCIQVNNAADYAVERGTGRQLTKEETIDILKKCEEEGLVHVVDNSETVGHVICNCCHDCCINWPGPDKAARKFVAPSRFAVIVDSDTCTACEICMDRCPFDAISMEGEDDTALINEENCKGCGICVVTCDSESMTLKEVRPEEYVTG